MPVIRLTGEFIENRTDGEIEAEMIRQLEAQASETDQSQPSPSQAQPAGGRRCRRLTVPAHLTGRLQALARRGRVQSLTVRQGFYPELTAELCAAGAGDITGRQVRQMAAQALDDQAAAGRR